MGVACAREEAELPAIPSSIRLARAMARRIAEACGADPAEVALCVSEATTNAVQHAYRLAPLDPANLRVSAWPEPEHLVIEVRDSGMGMRPRPDSPGIGLGLPLIANIAMSVDICDADPGTIVRMTFACSG